MKKYYKPEVRKVTLATKEQVLTHCKTSDAANDPACWIATAQQPAKEHYHVDGTG